MRNCVQCSARMNSILAELTPAELKEVEKLLVHQSFKSGEVLFCEGEEMHGSYIVKSGRVKLYKSSYEGERQILRVINPGEIVGLCVLRGKSNYGHTAETMENSILCYLDQNRLDRLFSINQELSKKFLRAITNEIQRAYEKIYVLGTKSARGKMANFLISLLNGKEQEIKDGVQLELNMSRSEIAEILGMSTETSIRVISQFKKEDLISGQGKHLTVVDAKQLQKESNGF